MGLNRTVRFRTAPPAWTAARDLLAARGVTFQVRMIDGQLAFPDEEPPEFWNELRLSKQGGMVTVRREGNCLVFVIWGSADNLLRDECNELVKAFAEAGEGEIDPESP